MEKLVSDSSSSRLASHDVIDLRKWTDKLQSFFEGKVSQVLFHFCYWKPIWCAMMPPIYLHIQWLATGRGVFAIVYLSIVKMLMQMQWCLSTPTI